MRIAKFFSTVTVLAVFALVCIPTEMDADCQTDLKIVNNSEYDICIELIVSGCICSPAVCVDANSTKYLQVGEGCCFVAARYGTMTWCRVTDPPCGLPLPWVSIDVTECTITIE